MLKIPTSGNTRLDLDFLDFNDCSNYVPSADFKLEGVVLTFTVMAEDRGTSYEVKVVPAPGGRVGGAGRKDKMGVNFAFQCQCRCYAKHFVCKHIGALCILHFN